MLAVMLVLGMALAADGLPSLRHEGRLPSSAGRQAAARDSALFPPREVLIRLFTNCDEARWPWGLDETLVPKSDSELTAGVVQRRALENRWRAYYNERAGDSIVPTGEDQWVYPLGVRGRLLNNFGNPRAGGPHEALDIFVTREGAEVRSPVSGVVVAAGDDWQGGWARRRGGLFYEGGGLSRRAGNGVMIYDPSGDQYLYFAHLQPRIAAHAGDLIRVGRVLGRVGHSGNASQPGHGRHLHFAYKRAGTGCSVDGVLVSVNPYRMVRAARSRIPARP